MVNMCDFGCNLFWNDLGMIFGMILECFGDDLGKILNRLIWECVRDVFGDCLGRRFGNDFVMIFGRCLNDFCDFGKILG